MGFRDLLGNGIFPRIILVLWIVSAAFMVFLLSQIDGVVHGELYSFGLQYSAVWAGKYWALIRLMYLCMAVPAALSTVALGAGLFARHGGVVRPAVKIETKPVNGKVENSKGNSMVISCPSCKRVFGKPLVMLDFSSGKTKLVNVCPYCNHVLGGADEKDSSDIQIVDLNKKTAR